MLPIDYDQIMKNIRIKRNETQPSYHTAQTQYFSIVDDDYNNQQCFQSLCKLADEFTKHESTEFKIYTTELNKENIQTENSAKPLKKTTYLKHTSSSQQKLKLSKSPIKTGKKNFASSGKKYLCIKKGQEMSHQERPKILQIQSKYKRCQQLNLLNA